MFENEDKSMKNAEKQLKKCGEFNLNIFDLFAACIL